MTTDMDRIAPLVLPPRMWAALTDEQRASGHYVELELLPEEPSDRPVRWVNRAARRAEARHRR